VLRSPDFGGILLRGALNPKQMVCYRGYCRIPRYPGVSGGISLGSLRGILIGVGYLECPEKIPFHGYPLHLTRWTALQIWGRFGLEALLLATSKLLVCFEAALSSRSNCFRERTLVTHWESGAEPERESRESKRIHVDLHPCLVWQ